MSAFDAHACPRCGAAMPAGSPAHLCPACLLSGAIAATANDETIPMEPGAPRPSISQQASESRREAQSSPKPDDFPRAFGGYRLLGLLGRGGMGAVYEAEQLATGRRVALKILEQGLNSPEMRQRFLREGRLAAAITHPNSVYIFGTEEIDDQPVIAMEVAESGTLRDRVKKRGPLPVAEAVDAILDVIAGLEAAHKGGVLHRDVKPSNCFVSPDGSVKVGDFGLSVSTVAKADTFLTASGVMLGTPAYAPPEQLRGDEMDARADIYSVGATLFTLLTGRAPFEAENPVRVVAAVLNEKPTPLSELRADVPPGLAQTVMRCLAKKPENRFADYGALRDALLPYSSATPEAAPLGIRFLAGFVDEALCTLVVLIYASTVGAVSPTEEWLRDRTFDSALPWIFFSLFYVLYHAVPEGIWGAAPGKALFRLRVARPDGRAPGLARALLRAAIAFLALECGVFMTLSTTTAAEYRQAWAAEIPVAGDFVFFFAWWSLFLTMRRRNGFANVMDLASGTRVVVKPKGAARPAHALETAPKLPPEGAPSSGPYRIVGDIVPGEWISAYDPALRRPIWLRRRLTANLSRERRDLARPGRPRWLQSVDRGDGTWDAFEAPAGTPLSALATPEKRPPWASVRHWLHDLAVELDSAAKDGTLPGDLALDHVWITAHGRALLLDEPWPNNRAGEGSARFPGRDPAGQQRFLSAVAAQADPATLPLHAQSVLRNLAAGTFEKLSFLAGTLEALLARPARISRARRAASILTAPLLLFVVIVGSILLMIQMERAAAVKWLAKHPDLPPLPDVLRFRQDHDLWGATLQNPIADAHIAGHYAYLAGALGQPAGSDPDLPLSEAERRTLLAIFAAFPEISAEEVAEADRRVHAEFPVFLQGQETRRMFGTVFTVALSLALIAVVQLFTLAIFRNTPGQLLFGFAVVNKKGERAGRFRLFGRWLLIWLPLVLALFRLELTHSTDSQWTLHHAKMLAYTLAWLIGLGVALARPSRGLHDQWTKCWLVPR